MMKSDREAKKITYLSLEAIQEINNLQKNNGNKLDGYMHTLKSSINKNSQYNKNLDEIEEQHNNTQEIMTKVNQNLDSVKKLIDEEKYYINKYGIPSNLSNDLPYQYDFATKSNKQEQLSDEQNTPDQIISNRSSTSLDRSNEMLKNQINNKKDEIKQKLDNYLKTNIPQAKEFRLLRRQKKQKKTEENLGAKSGDSNAKREIPSTEDRNNETAGSKDPKESPYKDGPNSQSSNKIKFIAPIQQPSSNASTISLKRVLYTNIQTNCIQLIANPDTESNNTPKDDNKTKDTKPPNLQFKNTNSQIEKKTDSKDTKLTNSIPKPGMEQKDSKGDQPDKTAEKEAMSTPKSNKTIGSAITPQKSFSFKKSEGSSEKSQSTSDSSKQSSQPENSSNSDNKQSPSTPTNQKNQPTNSSTNDQKPPSNQPSNQTNDKKNDKQDDNNKQNPTKPTKTFNSFTTSNFNTQKAKPPALNTSGQSSTTAAKDNSKKNQTAMRTMSSKQINTPSVLQNIKKPSTPESPVKTNSAPNDQKQQQQQDTNQQPSSDQNPEQQTTNQPEGQQNAANNNQNQPQQQQEEQDTNQQPSSDQNPEQQATNQPEGQQNAANNNQNQPQQQQEEQQDPVTQTRNILFALIQQYSRTNSQQDLANLNRLLAFICEQPAQFQTEINQFLIACMQYVEQQNNEAQAQLEEATQQNNIQRKLELTNQSKFLVTLHSRLGEIAAIINRSITQQTQNEAAAAQQQQSNPQQPQEAAQNEAAAAQQQQNSSQQPQEVVQQQQSNPQQPQEVAQNEAASPEQAQGFSQQPQEQQEVAEKPRYSFGGKKVSTDGGIAKNNSPYNTATKEGGAEKKFDWKNKGSWNKGIADTNASAKEGWGKVKSSNPLSFNKPKQSDGSSTTFAAAWSSKNKNAKEDS